MTNHNQWCSPTSTTITNDRSQPAAVCQQASKACWVILLTKYGHHDHTWSMPRARIPADQFVNLEKVAGICYFMAVMLLLQNDRLLTVQTSAGGSSGQTGQIWLVCSPKCKQAEFRLNLFLTQSQISSLLTTLAEYYCKSPRRITTEICPIHRHRWLYLIISQSCAEFLFRGFHHRKRTFTASKNFASKLKLMFF